MWFSNDPDGAGLELHLTEDAAREAAEWAMEQASEAAADGGWSEAVDRICWGVVTESAVCMRERPAEPGSGFDTMQEWALRPATGGA